MLGPDHNQTGRGNLPQHGLPRLRIDIGALAEHLQPVVAEALHLLRRLSRQHVDDMHHAKTLAGAIDRGHRLDDGVGCVPRVSRGEAVVAVAAIARMRLAEPGQDRLPPAQRRLADVEQGVELGSLDALYVIRRCAIVDHAAAEHHVAHRIAHPRGGGVVIASSAARLLVVGFDRARHVEMGDEPHVGLVDAHAERHGRGHHDAILFQKHVLVVRAGARIHPRMIGQRANTTFIEPRRRLLHLPARQAVNDPALASPRGEEIQQLLPTLLPLHDRVGDVRPVEAGGEHGRVLKAKPLDDVRARRGVGRGGQRHARHAGEVCSDTGELAILRTKIVAPLRDAVRLVDGEQADVCVLQHLLESRAHQTFGRHVEQLQPIFAQIIPHHPRLIRVER